MVYAELVLGVVIVWLCAWPSDQLSNTNWPSPTNCGVIAAITRSTPTTACSECEPLYGMPSMVNEASGLLAVIVRLTRFGLISTERDVDRPLLSVTFNVRM